ncbi:MAG: ATP-binding protein [Saprospiraceae bacterium]
MNRLLKRQLKRHFGGMDNVPDEMKPFIDAIERSYNHYEEDRLLLERAMDISSEELVEANQQLREEAKAQKAVMSKLKSSLNTVLSISPDENGFEVQREEDILGVVTVLESQINTIKEYEENLTLIKHFIDQSTDSIEVADTSGRLFFINQKGADLLEDTVENLIGKYIYDVDNKMRGIDSWHRIVKAFKNRNKLTFTRLQKFKDNRSSLLMEIILNKIEINNNEYIIGVSRDITARRKAEKEREEFIEKLREMNEELEDFAYIVSHDLKAPLRGISTLTSWLMEDYKDSLDEEGQDLVQLLNRRVGRMYGLIEGILQYSRIGRTKTTNESLDLNKIVSEVMESLQGPKGFEMSVEGVLPTIYNDETQIRQVFQNFISNAIKYNDKGEKGSVKVLYQDLDTHWEFCIADNGPGIPPKYHEKIFQIFQTLQRRDDFESTGIGLTIVSKIIKNNQGQIRIESDIGKGAKFYFTLKKKT